jgi:hypothetical protein
VPEGFHDGSRSLKDRFDTRIPLLADYPEAQFVVRIRTRAVHPNGPRYVHRHELVRRLRFVPREDCLTPVPEWKRADWAFDALPEHDPARVRVTGTCLGTDGGSRYGCVASPTMTHPRPPRGPVRHRGPHQPGLPRELSGGLL